MTVLHDDKKRMKDTLLKSIFCGDNICEQYDYQMKTKFVSRQSIHLDLNYQYRKNTKNAG